MSGRCRLAVTVRSARDHAETRAAFELRRRVFCDEQGVDEAVEFDGLDEESVQIVAVDEKGVLATCRLRMLEDGRCKLERMAVEAPLRRAGIGLRLLEGAEAEALRAGATEMVIHAQRRVEGFYAAAGYVAEGDSFLEENIEHVLMRRALTA